MNAELPAFFFHQLQFRLCIGRKCIDCNDRRQSVNLRDVLHVLQKIRKSLFQCLQILLTELFLFHASVMLQRSYRRNDNDRIRLHSAHPAFNVQELLRSEIGAESGFRNDIIRQLARHFCRNHRVTSVSNIRKRSAVNERRRSFQCLHQIRFQRILQKRRCGSLRVKLSRRHRLIIICISDNNRSQTLLQIRNISRETQDGHNFACHRDIKSVLPRSSVRFSAQSVHYKTELTVIHIHTALPGNLSRVDPERVPLLNMIVQHRRNQIIRRPDCVEIPCKVQIDILHRYNLRIAASGGAALDSEHRTERRFPKCYKDILSDFPKAVRKTDRCRRLSFSCRCR